MHGNLLTIGISSFQELNDILPTHFDAALLGGGAYARGCIRLRPGASGRLGIDIAREGGAPAIVLDFMRRLRPRVADGVDAARKRDISNLDELVDLATPAYVVAKGKWYQPQTGESLDDWLGRVDQLLAEAQPDCWISVYDLHH